MDDREDDSIPSLVAPSLPGCKDRVSLPSGDREFFFLLVLGGGRGGGGKDLVVAGRLLVSARLGAALFCRYFGLGFILGF